MKIISYYQSQLRCNEEGTLFHFISIIIAARILKMSSFINEFLILTFLFTACQPAPLPPKDLQQLSDEYWTAFNNLGNAYRELVYETPDFYQYFRKATPIDLIERGLVAPVFCSMEIVGARPRMESYFGFSIWPRNCRA